MGKLQRPKLNEILLTLYLTFISISSVYLYVTRNRLILLFVILGMLAVFFVCSRFILKWVSLIPDRMSRSSGVKPSSKACLICFFAVSLLTLCILLICFAAGYPGSFETDCITQLRQAMDGHYDDWHPVWHTLVFYTLPWSLTGYAAAIVVFQIIYISAALGYMAATLYRHTGIIPAATAYLVIILNPFTLYISLCPYKDVGFAIAALVAVTIAADHYLSGAPDDYPVYKLIILGFMLTNATIFRYNGLLFAFFLLLALAVNMRLRRWLIIAISAVITFAIIRGPVYSLADVVHTDTPVIQVVGLPMSVIGNVAKETPQLLDEETAEFVYGIAPRDVWEERYARGNFNLMKYGGIYNPDVIEEAGTVRIVKMAGRCALASPQAALESLFALTDFVYGLDLQDKADIDVIVFDMAENDLGLSYQGNERLAGLMNTYYRMLKLNGLMFPRKLGFGILMVIVTVLGTCRLNRLSDWKRILYSFPLLAYDFGTMLLLSGHDARFFFISFLIWPVTVLICVSDTHRSDTDG